MKRIDIKTGFLCNNNCIFCVQGNNKEKGNRNFEEIKEDLYDSFQDGFREAVITGGECTIREDFFEIINYAKKLGFEKVQVQSNGRAFSYRDFCRKAADAGADEFAISVHGPCAEIHDNLTRSKGSFEQTIKGIKNLKETRKTVITNTVVVNQNKDFLEQTAKLLVDLKVDHFQIAFLHGMGNAEKNFKELVPRMREVKDNIQKALQTGMDNNIDVSSEAMPYCMMKGYERCIAEKKTPFTYVKGDEKDIEDFVSLRKNECKKKFDKCRKCKYDDVCEGPWKEYPENFGDSEFKPVLDNPEEINIELTNKCNLDCEFCFNRKDEKEIEKKDVFSVLDEASEAGIEAVRFTGGEPLLREDLEEILRYARSKGFYVILNTNGILIKEKDPKIFRNVNKILISFHETAKKDKIKEALKILEEQGIAVMLCTIASKRNIKILEEFYKAVKETGIKTWFLLRPVSRKKTIDREDVKDLAENMLRLNEAYSIGAFIANAIAFCSYDKEKMSRLCAGGKNDNGFSRIVVDAGGNIKPSYFSEKILGKAGKDRIMDCWNSGYMRDTRKLKDMDEKCRRCSYSSQCMGGLRFQGKDHLMKESE